MAEKLKKAREEILTVAATLGSIYLGVSLYTYYPWDPSLFTFSKISVRNYGGVAGAYLSDLIISFAGYPGYGLPVLILVLAVRRLLVREQVSSPFAGFALLFLSSSVMLALVGDTFNLHLGIKPGGLIGYYCATFRDQYLSQLGAYLFCLSAFVSSILLISPVSLTSLTLPKIEPARPERESS